MACNCKKKQQTVQPQQVSETEVKVEEKKEETKE